jgi:hypothetical protein
MKLAGPVLLSSASLVSLSPFDFRRR